jgi:hypothetical protein
VLTRDVLPYLQLEQQHLQTLPDTTQRLGSKDGDVAYTSREFSYLQASRRTKTLQSGGRTHASGMMEILHCGLIAQWRSELAPPPPATSKVLFIANAVLRAVGEVMTLLPRDNGTCGLCIIKGDDITLPDSRRLCRLRINDA